MQKAHDAFVAARAANEKARDRRDQAVRRAHETGASYQQIADVLKVHRQYIYEICTRGER